MVKQVIEIQAPNYMPIPCGPEILKVFLAGSIEMGLAENWQTRVIRALENRDNIIVFNPRRNDWDSSWEQSQDNPRFSEQVSWELKHLEIADVILVYFDPKTKSPISLLELGLFSRKAIVCCPHGFWRKGNVDIVCMRYHIPMFNTIDELIATILRRKEADHAQR